MTQVAAIALHLIRSSRGLTPNYIGKYHLLCSPYCLISKYTHERQSLSSCNILHRSYSDSSASSPESTAPSNVCVGGKEYPKDHMTNITPKIISLMDRQLLGVPRHPLNHLKKRLVNFLNERYHNNRSNPVFSVYDNIPPAVTVEQNFDQLLIPSDHVSREKKDNYYINSRHLLRAHTSAHQNELLASGLNNFVVFGDVYRRDQIDATHYPVFHQMEGVRLYTPQELLSPYVNDDTATPGVCDILTGSPSTNGCSPDDLSAQAVHTEEAVLALTVQLKACLQDMAAEIFGKESQYRWVAAHFPFTQPSWELEVWHNNEWLEVLGCGIVQQRILENAGVRDRVGWAFGLGLERWAMKLYNIPDIRLFWTTDMGFLSQFNFDDCNKPVNFKPVSHYSPCPNDISFWLPVDSSYDENDFYDLVRQVGGDTVEQVQLLDVFTNSKKGLTSHCYRIVYRSMERTLTQQEVNVLHAAIEREATDRLGVTVR